MTTSEQQAADEVRALEESIHNDPNNVELQANAIDESFFEIIRSGKRQGRDEVLAPLVKGLIEIEDYPVVNLETRVLGDVVLATGRGKASGTRVTPDGREPFSRHAHFVHVWHKRDGEWKVVYAQSTEADD